MEPSRRAELLKRWALEEGFDRAGVAAVGPSRHGEAFRAWLARGDHAGMEYMGRRSEARLDPRRLLDGARSALCVARQYHPTAAGGDAEAGDLWPRVARYARGEDYHRLMERRLEALERRIAEGFPGTRTRRYVDTGPLLERELAARAGLGAVGKNTNLLHPEAGSWFLIGELLTTLELAADRPLADPCGSCSRCLEACPTGALPEPYRLDSRRCISYWTIEHRGPIPGPMRSRLAGWVFGCDVCQEVCPWNEAPATEAEPAFTLPAERSGLDLAGLLALDRDAYLERFRHSPMKRARREGLRRNAALAMGASRDRRYVEPLVAAAGDEDPAVRAAAVWALGEIGGRRVRQALAAASAGEGDPEVRVELAEARRRAASG